VPLAGWLGYRYAGHALDAVAARSLALRLTTIGAVAGSVVTVLLGVTYRAVLFTDAVTSWSLATIPMGVVHAVPGAAVGAFVVSMAWIWFMRSGVIRPPAEEPAL
jgi:hypothetical protein